MRIQHVYYPRGYRRWLLGSEAQAPHDGGRVEAEGPNKVMFSDGDAEVMALFKDYRTSEVDITSWSFVKRVVDVAGRLLPNLQEFFNAQALNPYLHGAGFQFLETLAQQHNRNPVHLSPTTAAELVEVDPRPRGNELRRRTTPKLYPVVDGSGMEPTTRLTARWLEVTPTEDIVWTLYVLFGSEASQ